MFNNIKNIIFDFGGVIHDIRYENVGEAFARMGCPQMKDFYTKDLQSPEMDAFEKGLISPQRFRDYIRSTTGKDFTNQQVDEIVNAILVDVPRDRVELLIALRKKYRLFLFSNTNLINYECFTSRLEEKYGFDIFTRCFDKAYFSHQMHCRKPDPDGFRLILDEQQLNPSETVFVDDIEKNLQGAERTGIIGIHLAKGTVCNLFDNDGNILISEKY